LGSAPANNLLPAFDVPVPPGALMSVPPPVVYARGYRPSDPARKTSQLGFPHPACTRSYCASVLSPLKEGCMPGPATIRHTHSAAGHSFPLHGLACWIPSRTTSCLETGCGALAACGVSISLRHRVAIRRTDSRSLTLRVPVHLASVGAQVGGFRRWPSWRCIAMPIARNAHRAGPRAKATRWVPPEFPAL
jgi:hypothetical protein